MYSFLEFSDQDTTAPPTTAAQLRYTQRTDIFKSLRTDRWDGKFCLKKTRKTPEFNGFQYNVGVHWMGEDASGIGNRSRTDNLIILVSGYSIFQFPVSATAYYRARTACA